MDILNNRLTTRQKHILIFQLNPSIHKEQKLHAVKMTLVLVPHKTKQMVRRAPAVKIVTKICSFVTIVQGTFLTFSVVRY